MKISLGTIKGNQCFDNNCVVDESEFNAVQLEALYRGETVTDKYGEEVYWCEEEEI